MHADMTDPGEAECVPITTGKHVRYVTCWTALDRACACGPAREEVALHIGSFDTW